MPQGIFHIAKQYFIRVAYFTCRKQISLKKALAFASAFFWRRHPDLNRGIELLQSFALPLGYGAVLNFRTK